MEMNSESIAVSAPASATLGAPAMDLAPYRHGPIFESTKDSPDEFRTIVVDPELGTVVW